MLAIGCSAPSKPDHWLYSEANLGHSFPHVVGEAMKLSIYVALAAYCVVSAAPLAWAQSTENALLPAELPPETFKESQYVDSQGCVFIRAGVDGSVSWIPRVSASRKQICGQTPTFEPVEVKQAATGESVVPASTEPVTPSVAEAQVAIPTDVAKVHPKPRPVPAAVATAAPVKPKPARSNNAPVTRKKTVVPMTVVNKGTGQIPQNTRVVARHIFDNRANTRNVKVPRGYRPVWKDGRLNPRRAEMTTKPSLAHSRVGMPRGYTRAWDDGRLNQNRGGRTARGDAQTDQIWSQTVPRTLLPVPTRGQVIAIEAKKGVEQSPYWNPPVRTARSSSSASVTRLSTRSMPTHRFEMNDR